MDKIANTSIANKAMLRFAKEYAEKHWYLEGWQKPDDFWANKLDEKMHPDKPKVVRCSYVAPVFDEDKEGKGHWSVPRVEIDSYWGNPRIAVVDPNGNFCCLSYNRDTNEFSEGQFWRNGGLSLAAGVKAKLELYIQMFKDGYDMKIE